MYSPEVHSLQYIPLLPESSLIWYCSLLYGAESPSKKGPSFIATFPSGIFKAALWFLEIPNSKYCVLSNTHIQ